MLASTLVLASGAISTALRDLEDAQKSSIFMALFKDPKSSAYVRDVLRNIAYAKPLKGLQPNRKAPTAPRFMCLDSSTGSPFYYLKGMIPYLFCTQPGAGQAFYIGEGSYIFLCPSYW